MTLTEQITRALVLHLSSSGSLILTNVFVNPSPWECDVLAVTKTFCLTEYEIKVSVNDFRADFRKDAWFINRGNFYGSMKIRKHDYYLKGLPSGLDTKNVPTIPKKFVFVAPRGMISATNIPAQYGLMEFGDDRFGRPRVRLVKRPKDNKLSKPIEPWQLFHMARKAASQESIEASTVGDTEREWQIDI